ncbi:MAG TPA: hypothetical protein PLS81_08300 [Deltaproteobacteria bacterium]|nr:hypothetical protein [Deltaproteobacteria bacterium]HOM29445.1 hypothetical protein [Deltaproteobacteria bacterium]HPP80098.1 hypothetical protein [Deltaproteobacteria bacterium]
MRTKAFVIVLSSLCLMALVSSAILFLVGLEIRGVNLGTLSDSISKEDARILSLILEHIPPEKIEEMALPESWEEIFILDPSELTVVSSTTPGHRGMPLYRHPLLLDHAKVVVSAIKAQKTTIEETPSCRVVAAPLPDGRLTVAIKPKAWEQGLVQRQEEEVRRTTSSIWIVAAAFTILGILVSVFAAFLVARKVTATTDKAVTALEALSLGDFSVDLDALGSAGELDRFKDSFVRLKTSLTMALEMLSRR